MRFAHPSPPKGWGISNACCDFWGIILSNIWDVCAGFFIQMWAQPQSLPHPGEVGLVRNSHKLQTVKLSHRGEVTVPRPCRKSVLESKPVMVPGPVHNLIKLLPLSLAGEWVIFSAEAAQLMAILKLWPQWLLLLYLLKEFWLRSILGDDFIFQQPRNCNAKRCMGMNVLVPLLDSWWNSNKEEPFDSGILTLRRSVWLIYFFGASPALVIFAEELEQPGSDSPWLYGIPHLWRGEGPAAEIHSQTWQVRGSSASRALLCSFLQLVCLFLGCF